VKALAFTDIYKKQGVLTAVGAFTKVTQVAASMYVDDTSAEAAAMYVVEIKASDLDINNNFDSIRATVADVGIAAQLGCLFYVLYNARSGGSVGVSAIVD
jgi:hypothetical protein